MTTQNSKLITRNFLLPWLDVAAIAAWGVLMLRYWLNGKLNLLIHPDYFWLAIAGGIGLLIVSGLKAFLLLSTRFQKSTRSRTVASASQHITLFPPGWSGALLLLAAIGGMIITPRVFTSQTAISRGITDSLSVTRSQPQAFKTAKRPEDRSLVDWVRTLNVYPEPDAYAGQKVKVQGFVIHTKELPEQYLMLSRFVLTCCAADAYPVGLPVKLLSSRTAYPPDRWLEVEGEMIVENLENKRQLTIQPSSIEPIPEPKNPYDY